jgi:hypothetical protein
MQHSSLRIKPDMQGNVARLQGYHSPVASGDLFDASMQPCFIVALRSHYLGAAISRLAIYGGHGVDNMGVSRRLTLRPTLCR